MAAGSFSLLAAKHSDTSSSLLLKDRSGRFIYLISNITIVAQRQTVFRKALPKSVTKVQASIQL